MPRGAVSYQVSYHAHWYASALSYSTITDRSKEENAHFGAAHQGVVGGQNHLAKRDHTRIQHTIIEPVARRM